LRGSAAPQEDTRKLYLEWREVLNQLRRRHPNYANLVSATTLNYAEIQALWKTDKLSADTCVIEFFFPQDYLLVACVQKESTDSQLGLTTHVVMEPQSLELIREDIATFFEMSSTEGWEVPVSLCRRLYQSLLGPVLENLNPGVERLLLIPHGSLYHLPFSALHDQSGYVCERFAVSYVPTVSLIPILASAQNRKSEAGGDGGTSTRDARYLVTAISDYSATREGGMVFSSRLRSSAGLEDLAYTMEEANSILSLGQSGTVSADASRTSGNIASGSTLLTNEEVKRSLPELFGDFDVVHFAGHAIFNHDEPMASGLVLSDGSILSAASILEGNALRTERGRCWCFLLVKQGSTSLPKGARFLVWLEL
jgi:CHAT domain-containing protein